MEPIPTTLTDVYAGHEAAYAGLSLRTIIIGDSRAIWPADQAQTIGPDVAILGIAGEHVEQILWRCINSALNFSSVERVVVVAGTNNLIQAAHAPVDIAFGVQQIVQVLAARAPLAAIRTMDVFEGYLPMASFYTEAKRKEINRRIPHRARQCGLFKHVALPPMDPMDPTIFNLDKSGARLHLNATGYLPVTAAVSAALAG